MGAASGEASRALARSLLHILINIAFRVQHIDTLVIYLRWARKMSTSHRCVEVDSRVLLGRGVVSINKGTDRSGAMSVMRSNLEVLQRGAESLGPSRVVDVAAASGGDGWRISVANVARVQHSTGGRGCRAGLGDYSSILGTQRGGLCHRFGVGLLSFKRCSLLVGKFLLKVQ